MNLTVERAPQSGRIVSFLVGYDWSGEEETAMDKTSKYLGQIITVRAVKSEFNPQKWEPRISISGALQSLTFNTVFPRREFDTEEEAITYGMKAAEWIVDHPPTIMKKVE